MTHRIPEGFEKQVRHEFNAARGEAVAAYVDLEGAMLHLFAHLMNIDDGLAGISFFRLNNARSRLAILDTLLKRKYQNKFNLFWNSLTKILQATDAERNNMVHWAVVGTYDTPSFWLTLTPPNYWESNANTPSITVEDIRAFKAKCDFLSEVLTYFWYLLIERQPTPPLAWQQLFLEPITYPPPAGYPLGPRTGSVPRSQPRPYRA